MSFERSDGPAVPVLQIRDLSVEFPAKGGRVRAVSRVSYDVHAGEIVAVVGESGSGKSVTALAALGLLPASARVTGRILINGADMLALDEPSLERMRGAQVAIVFQNPLSSLNPTVRVGRQITEAIALHEAMPGQAMKARAVELLSQVGIEDPRQRFDAFPHQLSGGQRQRVAIAIALSCRPSVLIADEATTALDVTVQAQVLDLLRRLRDETRCGLVVITHNMGVVADIADRVIVMKDGEVVEAAPVDALFHAPRHDYTRRLLRSVPKLGAPSARVHDAPEAPTGRCALQVEGVCVGYRRPDGSVFHAAQDVSFSIGRNEVFGLIGESGSGKSTIGRCAAGLTQVSAGRVMIDGQDIGRLGFGRMQALRRNFAMIFQDPGASLDPRRTVAQNIAEPLIVHRLASRHDIARTVLEWLDKVDVQRSLAGRYPFELSGGQKQRVAIARALSISPSFLIADEPTSALDVSVQARVLDIFARLQETLRFACLFISHDLAVVESMCRRMAVMRSGRIVELGPVDTIMRHPGNAYTERLIASIPVPDPRIQRARHVPRPSQLTAG